MRCVVSGYQQREIHDSAWRQLQSVEDGTTNVVGVNLHQDGEVSEVYGQIQDLEIANKQIQKIAHLFKTRNTDTVSSALENIRQVAKDGGNLMEPMIEAYKVETTLGEVNDVLREIFGTWVAPSGV